jgi:hypothetical protein
MVLRVLREVPPGLVERPAQVVAGPAPLPLRVRVVQARVQHLVLQELARRARVVRPQLVQVRAPAAVVGAVAQASR